MVEVVVSNVGLKPTIGHRRPGILAFLVFWWPVWFIAITAGEMWYYHGVTFAVATAVMQVVVLFLSALVP